MAFLNAATSGHDPLSMQSPVVYGPEPDVLIEASAAYPKLERLTLDARERIWFAFRIFDPDTPLYLPESRELGLKTWSDLLAYKLERGISFRLLLTDFDPVVGDTLHEMTWRSLVTLFDRQAASVNPWDMQICPALHEGRASRYVRMLLAPAVYARIHAKRNKLNAMDPETRSETFEFTRGYHRYFRLSSSTGKIQWRPKIMLPRIHPVTHHHKLAVFDDETAILGGLDVNERRYDDPSHDRRSVDTWHDVSLSVTGPAVAHVAQHIAGVWNMDYVAARQRMIRAQVQSPRLLGHIDPALSPLDLPPSQEGATGDVPMQVVCTVSRNKKKGRYSFRMRPTTVNNGLEAAHLGLVRDAHTLLYIETQFFRHKPLAEALAERAGKCADLRLIMLLPAAPEEIAFDDKNGLDSRYGERLQADCIDIVREAFGPRALFVCPAKRESVKDAGRAAVNGAAIIYVHAKVAVADDEWGIIGSANMNGRSLRWDSELGLLWKGPSAGTLRRRLATDWIDAEAAETPMIDTFDLWRKTAWANAGKPVAQRRGFLLPYLPDEADAMGVNIPLLPPETV